MNKVPVLMIVFNRPETTQRVFEAVRAYQPKHLYVSADGPRSDHPEDAARIQEVRNIFERIDWPCKLFTHFLPENRGCRYAPPEGISWFFENEEQGVILEDDCLPSQDFFRFAEKLLDKYHDNEKIMHIGGANFQNGRRKTERSYYFSNSPHIWGWATWRRAWKYYDVDMKTFPDYVKSGKIKKRLPGRPYQQWRYLQQMDATYNHSPYFRTWDWQWTFTLFDLEGIAIIPEYNMISNIGFSGTHTVDTSLCEHPFDPLPESLKEPPFEIDLEADDLSFKLWYRGSWKDRIHYMIDSLKKRI